MRTRSALSPACNPGEVRDAAGVEAFLRAYLEGCAGAHRCGCAALRAGEPRRTEDLASCLALDEMLDAMKTPSELRDASRQMGRQTLRVANHLAMPSTARRIWQGRCRGHHARPSSDRFRNDRRSPANGPRRKWPSAYLYSTSAALVGAALRLLPLGQLAGQRILWNVRPLIASACGRGARQNARTDMWSFAPALEIASMRHASLDARLFRS